MIAHRPGLLRASSVSRCCFHNWCQNRKSSNPAPVATPGPPIPPAAAPLQPTPVAVQAAADPEVNPAAAAAAAAAPQSLPTVVTTPKPPPTGRSFFDAMKFNGPAPELINGRLAMIGILAAAKTEIDTGTTVMQQAQQAPWWLYAWLLLWLYASLVPILKGARHEAFGIFSPRAEIANGRAAMLGFAILLALEYKARVPFF